MGRHGPPEWNRRDCRFDHLVAAAIKKGYGTVMKYQGVDDYERAHDIRKGVYRCAKHRGLTAVAGPSGRTVDGDDMGVHKAADGTYSVWYFVTTKALARKSIIERYGTDRTKWPYDPRRPATQEEKDGWANRDESGRIVRH